MLTGLIHRMQTLAKLIGEVQVQQTNSTEVTVFSALIF